MLANGGCPKTMLSIKDALEAVEGKWKLLILFSLSEKPKRFNELSKEVIGITDKMLSKELKLLEMNKLIKREAFDAVPPKVEYSITEHGMSLEKVLDELHFWGLSHRSRILSDW
ncbi:HxlR family transcriptional regulator [Chryseobacterium piperi]|uniref:HxlR family transcriptional regulator n=1 Tax=Chryseobacterium piperi TaxID=558152 RepID=A0A086AN97_9FLAO|nr:helix-turn-helix domain-containing protein [Chryseobacterium piperi]ASW76248.1 transcriptional regulator [Chryseobacterium piperi]KFF18161.1 HxlR family transcriptional regulator [Chryseobacterium piperi]